MILDLRVLIGDIDAADDGAGDAEREEQHQDERRPAAAGAPRLGRERADGRTPVTAQPRDRLGGAER